MSAPSHEVISPADIDAYEMFAMSIDYEYTAVQVKEACDALGITEDRVSRSREGTLIADWLEDKHNG